MQLVLSLLYADYAEKLELAHCDCYTWNKMGPTKAISTQRPAWVVKKRIGILIHLFTKTSEVWCMVFRFNWGDGISTHMTMVLVSRFIQSESAHFARFYSCLVPLLLFSRPPRQRVSVAILSVFFRGARDFWPVFRLHFLVTFYWNLLPWGFWPMPLLKNWRRFDELSQTIS